MKLLKKSIEEFRRLQEHRRRQIIEKMSEFKNVTLTISDRKNNFTVTVKVSDNTIFIKPQGGVEVGPEERLDGILTLTQEYIVSRMEVHDSIIFDLEPPLPSFYKLKFRTPEIMEQFLYLIRASRTPRPQSSESAVGSQSECEEDAKDEMI